MRPISISLEGFFAYRQPTELDLESVDYFSLTGPTGAGKSSLIDAMVFALYGRVPRLGGRDVASAISAGSDRARVSFLFRADDRTYTVTRLLQRTKSGGATTKEARLESEGLEPTSGAGDVTAAVSELLRLNFDDFTRTVVLPQGEFARFLQASPGERQEILRNLLGLDIYRRVGERARRLADNANSEVDSATGLLEGLGVPTDDQIGEAIVQRTKIDQLVVDVAKLESKLEEKVAGVKSLEADMARGEDAIFRLDDLAPPEHLGETGQLIQQAEQAIEDHRSRLESVNETIEEIESALSEMADKTTIERLSALYGRLDRVESSLASNEARTAKEKLDQAESDLAAASEGLETAKSEYEAVRARHAAHELAAGLVAGDRCPVCDSPVGVIELEPVADLDRTREKMDEARDRLNAVADRVKQAGGELSAALAARDQMVAKRDEILEDLGSEPIAADKLESALKNREEKEEQFHKSQVERDEVRLGLKQSEERLADMAEKQRTMTTLLMAERDKVSDLSPELPGSEDPVIGWKALLDWRDRARETQTEGLATLVKSLEVARSDVGALGSQLDEVMESHGIEPVRPASTAVARAQEQVHNQVRLFEDLKEKSLVLRTKIDSAKKSALTAAALANHLRANGFERWLMLGAVSQLVSRANAVLSELSGSVYSLSVGDDGSFDIVDHRNADEMRPISTLSGGETFMVSLALALALAETLSSGGGGRLEAIILDEGFGTLDQESVDVVAGVLEGLTDTGLMVGIITHVADLAARAPVRFKVDKGPGGSTLKGPYT